MAYNNSIPQPGDRPSQSQSQILANFSDLKTYLDKNHVALVDPLADSGGKHTFVEMPEQGAAPGTAASEGALYTKDDGTRTALYWQQENAGTEIQMTGPDPLAAQNGYTFLPGGILMQWGFITPLPAEAVITPLLFATSNINFPSNCFNVSMTLIVRASGTGNANNISPQTGSVSSTGFSYNYTGTGSHVAAFWTAIGN